MAQRTITVLDPPLQGEVATTMTIGLPVEGAPGTTQTGRFYIKPDGSVVVRANQG